MRSSHRVLGLVCLVVTAAAARPAKAETPAPAAVVAQVQPVTQTAVKIALARKTSPGVDLGAAAAPTGAQPAAFGSTVVTRVSLGTIVVAVAAAPMAPVAAAVPAPVLDAPIQRAPKPRASMRALRRMNADAVFGALQPAFQACYAQGGSHGKGMVALNVDVAATGEVESAEVMSNAGVEDGVASCVAAKMREAHFTGPGGTGLSVQLPVQLGL